MVIYPVPAAVTQAKIQLVIDETAKAPCDGHQQRRDRRWSMRNARPSSRRWSTSRPDHTAVTFDAGSTNWLEAAGNRHLRCRFNELARGVAIRSVLMAGWSRVEPQQPAD